MATNIYFEGQPGLHGAKGYIARIDEAEDLTEHLDFSMPCPVACIYEGEYETDLATVFRIPFEDDAEAVRFKLAFSFDCYGEDEFAERIRVAEAAGRVRHVG